MLVEVRIARRYGRRLPERDIENRDPLVGDLQLVRIDYRGDGVWEILRLQARDSTAPSGRLAELFEPRLVSLHGGLMLFRGFEASDRAGLVQEWRCRLLT